MKKIILSLIIMLTAVITINSNVYAADVKNVSSLNAHYSGDSLIVGAEYDSEKLTVTAYYENGTSEVITDYSTGTKKITRDGENTFVIVYKGKSVTFTITGKTIMSIDANYSGGSHSVGNKINSKDVTVTVTYSDYTTDAVEQGYTIAQATITRIGDNEITVMYSGKRATFTVIGTEAKNVESVFAQYIGGGRVQGASIREEDVMLTALYTDGTSELIYNFTMNPPTVRNIGVNAITISFKGRSSVIYVEGIQKVIESITAKYTGGSITVGKSVSLSNITVTATYNDGTTGTETNFDIVGSSKISVVGNNVFTVDAGGQKADITVTGIEPTAADFAKAPSYTITNSKQTASVAVDIPSEYTADDLLVTSINTNLVKRLLTREIRDGDYIPFTITLSDVDLDVELPMTVQMTPPSDYNINGCSIYFSPNQKTVIARMNTEIIDNKYLQFKMFHEGTYILSYDYNWAQE